MSTKTQFIGLYTIIHREWIRMFRIASQVFLPPVITSVLYFLIFGTIIGDRIGSIEGMDYALFIAPGLVMMSVITNAYANVSTSLFSTRFQKNIEEMLISPMHYGLILLGYTLGGVIRGVVVAILILIVCTFFLDLKLQNIPATLTVVALVAALFSLAGFTNGMIARNFDDVAIVPTFILMPFSYLGGVFYSINMLPPFWQYVAHFNPILYMINALRYVMVDHREHIHFAQSITLMVVILLILTGMNLYFLKKGIGLRD